MASRIIGKWRLLEQIGAGGNGEVRKCADSATGEIFAMKILTKKSKESYQRFLDEANIMKVQRAAGILPIIDCYFPASFDAIQANDTIYYVMPLATPAKQCLFGCKFAEKVRAIIDIIKMLSQLHHQGIAHRDIKIENILKYQDHYVLSDFGLVFYKDKPRVTNTDERIGARRTLAPEMERPGSKDADPFKADVYSIAKTIWCILTENTDCFEGQYNRNQAIRLVDNVQDARGIYFTPLDELLTACTDVAPANRPDIDQVLSRFDEWVKIQDDFAKSNRKQWIEVISALFPYSIPQHAEWTNMQDIMSVLSLISRYDSLNHLFFPDGGGLDLTAVSKSYEDHCLELDFDGLRRIINPKILIFESIEADFLWNYFRLECNPMEPVLKSTPKDCSEEGVSEIAPLEYEEYHVLEDRDVAITEGYHVTPLSRQIERHLKGSIVIFSKNSLYNRTTSTYDGRHNRINAKEFRDYIEQVARKYRKAPDGLYLMDF